MILCSNSPKESRNRAGVGEGTVILLSSCSPIFPLVTPLFALAIDVSEGELPLEASWRALKGAIPPNLGVFSQCKRVQLVGVEGANLELLAICRRSSRFT